MNKNQTPLWTLDQAKHVRAAYRKDEPINLGDGLDWNRYTLRAEALRQRDRIWQNMKAIADTAEREGRDFLASEKQGYEKFEARLEEISGFLEDSFVDRTGIIPPEGDSEERPYAEGVPLTAHQSFTGFAQSRGHGKNYDSYYDQAPLSLSKYLRGAMTGDWRGSDREQHAMNAMSGASPTGGGVLIPTTLSAQIIDLARPMTRVFEAGATVVPMDSRTVDVPRWTQDPTMAWRTENAVINESDAAMDKVTLTAKSLATVVRVSRELVEDTDITNALMNAFASELAKRIDYASLYADGTNGAPLGIKNTVNVTKTPLATNGANPSWDNMVDAVGRLRDKNETPTAQIMSDRSARVLAKVKDSQGQFLTPPTYLDGIPRLTTSIVPNSLTVGTSSDTSDVFTADWTQLLIGLRVGLTITVLNERYMTTDGAATPAGGQYGFVAWWRGDMAVARPNAFDIITGARSI